MERVFAFLKQAVYKRVMRLPMDQLRRITELQYNEVVQSELEQFSEEQAIRFHRANYKALHGLLESEEAQSMSVFTDPSCISGNQYQFSKKFNYLRQHLQDLGDEGKDKAPGNDDGPVVCPDAGSCGTVDMQVEHHEDAN